MYQEEYEERGFPFRDFLLKLIIIIIFVFLLIWILPKFVRPNIKNKCANNSCEIKTTTKDFNNGVNIVKKSLISYYNKGNLPKKDKENKKLTIQEMINKKILKDLKNENDNKYDYKNSYATITKDGKKYLLKINLKIGNKEDYKVYSLGHYSYCKNYLCKKKKTKSNKKTTKPVAKVPIENNNTTKNTNISEESKVADKTFLYEYEKITGIKFSSWSAWSNWTKTNCSTQASNCDDKDVNCTKRVKRYNTTEKNGTHTKSYTKTRNVLTKIRYNRVEACANNNYVIINNQTYITVGSWKLIERSKEFKIAPNDTERYRYEYVGANFKNCKETCSEAPSYYYNVYKYDGTMTKVSSPKSTISTSNCTYYKTVNIPVYNIIKNTEVSSRIEPLYQTICYQSIKTRTVTNRGDIHKKWSKNNDAKLLNNGWKLTGKKKQYK